MKLSFKLLLFFSMFLSCAHANPGGILITYHQHQSWVGSVKQYLQREFSVPESLMSEEWKKNPCEVEEEHLLQICITDEGEMKVASVKSKEVRQAFQIFMKKD